MERHVLEECADCSIECANDRTVKACKFVMITHSQLVRDLFTSFDITRIPMHATEAKYVQAVVDVLHDVVRIDTMPLEHVVDTLKGLDLLICTAHHARLLQRLWECCQSIICPDELLPYAAHFLYSLEHRAVYIDKMKRLCHHWVDFKRVFKDIVMSKELAIFCMHRLCNHYNPLFVFKDLTSKMASTEDVVEVFCTFRTGVYYHPAEIVEAVLMLRRLKHTSDLIKRLMEVMYDGLSNHELLPAKKCVYGSCLNFVNTPLASCLLLVESRFPNERSIKCSEWLKVWLNIKTGSMEAEIATEHLKLPHLVSNMIVRLSAVRSLVNRETHQQELCMDEVCYSTTVFQDAVVHLTEHIGRDPRLNPYEQCFLTALKSQTLKYIRIDLLLS